MTSYKCLLCKTPVDVDFESPYIQCTKCGSRILIKERPPASKKRVKAI